MAAPKAPLLDAAGKKSKDVTLEESVFAAEIKPHVVHETVRAEMNADRRGTRAAKSRGLVAGGRAKPWRQKGTGRARQGTRTAPHWVGGGVVFGPHPRSHDVKMNSKMRRAALRGVLSAKRADDALRVVEGFDLDAIGTRPFMERLAGWNAGGKVLLVLAGRDPVVERSARNVREVRVLLADSLNVVDLLQADTIVLTRDALDRISEVYA